MWFNRLFPKSINEGLGKTWSDHVLNIWSSRLELKGISFVSGFFRKVTFDSLFSTAYGMRHKLQDLSFAISIPRPVGPLKFCALRKLENPQSKVGLYRQGTSASEHRLTKLFAPTSCAAWMMFSDGINRPNAIGCMNDTERVLGFRRKSFSELLVRNFSWFTDRNDFEYAPLFPHRRAFCHRKTIFEWCSMVRNDDLVAPFQMNFLPKVMLPDWCFSDSILWWKWFQQLPLREWNSLNRSRVFFKIPELPESRYACCTSVNIPRFIIDCKYPVNCIQNGLGFWVVGLHCSNISKGLCHFGTSYEVTGGTSFLEFFRYQNSCGLL